MNAAEIFKKLRFDKAERALILNAPDSYLSNLKNQAYESKALKKKEKYDFIQVFATSQEELESLLKKVHDYGKYDCVFWACYPKGTGKLKSDIKRDTVWAAFNLIGLDSVTAVSIDETWSALRARPFEMIGK